ncbi:hypothetical protein [Thermoactinomyces sp. DSM 45892]|uniref:hypothetical protein n=1 Tax=Thermoactinomyces sp. DSM 45892 TaxID=1882753 RepID=UPI00089C2EB7|nr:hypothetical protein [Thermoactinomyces sp. DSM 45892]SDZ35055.1 hypothetical protein SAMN05444416_12411 [Thermoactinomyces sp. DSM 45892]
MRKKWTISFLAFALSLSITIDVFAATSFVGDTHHGSWYSDNPENQAAFGPMNTMYSKLRWNIYKNDPSSSAGLCMEVQQQKNGVWYDTKDKKCGTNITITHRAYQDTQYRIKVTPSFGGTQFQGSVEGVR